MDHSAVVFLLDDAGARRAIFTPPFEVAAFAADLRARGALAAHARGRRHERRGRPTALGARAFVALQYLLPQHWLSQLVHRLARSRVRWLKNALIGGFVAHFHPDIAMPSSPTPCSIASFNEFFTRALRADARPADPDPAALVSPVDGTISQLGRLDGSWLVQAKGHAYTLEALLAEEAPWAGAVPRRRLRHALPGAASTTIASTCRSPARCAPRGTCPGSCSASTPPPPPACRGCSRVTSAWCACSAAGALSFALVLVGALFVGSMSTVWHGEVTPRQPRRRATAARWRPRPPGTRRGARKWAASTWARPSSCCCRRRSGSWLAELVPGSAVRVGQALAQLDMSTPGETGARAPRARAWCSAPRCSRARASSSPRAACSRWIRRSS